MGHNPSRRLRRNGHRAIIRAAKMHERRLARYRDQENERRGEAADRDRRPEDAGPAPGEPETR